MRTWFAYTNGYNSVARLTAWRIFRTQSTLEGVPSFFKPSEIQTCIEHPPVIDWVIFPFLRDKLIQYHSKDPNLAQICSDIIKHYVVQAQLPELVANASPVAVNFTVWDIMTTLEGAGGPQSNGIFQDMTVRLPAPNLQELLEDKRYARLLHRHLLLDQACNISLDPSLFAIYPHLYEADQNLAVGVPIRLPNPAVWSAPRPVDSVTAGIYHNLASCATDSGLVEALTMDAARVTVPRHGSVAAAIF